MTAMCRSPHYETPASTGVRSGNGCIARRRETRARPNLTEAPRSLTQKPRLRAGVEGTQKRPLGKSQKRLRRGHRSNYYPRLPGSDERRGHRLGVEGAVDFVLDVGVP